MAQQSSNFFGEDYVAYNPFSQSNNDWMNQLSTLDQMFQGWAQTQRQGQQRVRANLQPDEPGGGGGGGGGGGTTPPSNVPPDQPCNNWQIENGQVVCYDAPGGNPIGPPPPGAPIPQPLPPGQNPTGPTPPGQNPQSPFPGFTGPPSGPFTSSGGATPAGAAPNMFTQNLPPELAQLRSSLANFLNFNLGQRRPMYPGNLSVAPDPRAMDAASMFRTAGGNVSSLASSMMPGVQDLMGYQAPGLTGMPDMSWLLGGGSVPDAAGELMHLASRGAGDVGNYLNFGSGIINAGLANNPFLTNNLQNFGSAQGALGSAGSYLGQGVGGPMDWGQSAYQDNASVEAWRNMAQTGGAPDITAALEAIRNQSNLAIEDDLAGIREHYGARGLGASSDVAEASARGAARGRADMNTQMTSLVADVMNQAAGRKLGAQSLAPSLAASRNAPWENFYARNQNAAGLATGIGNAFANTGTAGMAAGTGMQDALTRMASVLGQYGATSADATQAGTAALTAAGGLQSGAFDRALGASDIMSRLSLGQAGLQNDAAGIRNQAAGIIPGYLNAMTSAAGMGGSGMMDVARYMTGVQEGNVTRPWQAWEQAQQYPFLNSAVSLMNGQPAPQQMPVIPSQSNTAGLVGAGIAGGSSILSAMIMMGMISSRQLKEVFGMVDDSAILDAVQRLNVYRWKYKSMMSDKDEHVGPMAEDFQEIFRLGDGHTISIIDAFGILFSAVRGLAQELKRMRSQSLPLEA